MLGVVGEQPVAEHLTGHRVQAGVGLVEQRHLGPGRQAEDDADRRAHPARELLYLAVERQRKVGEQRLGQVAAPVRVEPRGHLEDLPDLEVGEGLVLADEDHPAQDRVVLDRAAVPLA
jgi:hypothetical protein